jgi:hypothetical protein
VIVRAVRVALTYDEAATYLKYISTPLPSVFDFVYATNHWLNTLLARLFVWVAGDRDWVLRLPSILGSVLYVGFGWLLLRRLRNRLIAFSGLLLLVTNPYLLEYFSLSRGYGLALGLLMGALFYMSSSLAAEAADERRADAFRSWVWAIASVLANFSMLNVCLAVFITGFASLAVLDRARLGSGAEAPFTFRGRTFVCLLLAAVAVMVAVFSQDVYLSARLYEPVIVRLGANPDSTDRARIFQINLRTEPLELARRGSSWMLEEVADTTRLRIELPLADADAVTAITVRIGGRDFVTTPGGSAWTRHDTGGLRVLESGAELSLPRSRVSAFRAVVNWSGDTRFVRLLAIRVLIGVLLWIALALAVLAIGRVAVRTRLVSVGNWRVFAAAVLLLAALGGAPLFLLARNDALYFGGMTGLIADTFRSLADNTFHGAEYVRDQTSLLLDTLGVLTALLAVAAVLGYRRIRGAAVHALVFLAVVALVSTASLVEGAVLHTPYPLGRTALYFIPPFLLFVIFGLDLVSRFGSFGRVAASVVAVAAATASTSHLLHTANFASTLDWPKDAATRTMMSNVERLGASAGVPSPIVLEVYWEYWPVAETYARRSRPRRVSVVIEPSEQPSDYEYLRARDARPGAEALSRYPVSEGVLVRTPAAHRRASDDPGAAR